MPTFPLPNLISSVAVEDFTQVITDRTQSRIMAAREFAGQNWIFDVRFSTLTQANGRQIDAFLSKMKGPFTPFDIVMPVISTPQGDMAGTVLVDGASQVGSTINLKGITTGTGLIAGDYIKFAGHNKAYKVVTDFVGDGGGLASVEIHPALVTSPPDAALVTFSSVPFTVRATSSTKYDIRPPDLYGMAITMEESF
jgi:hypothetical protein